LQKVENTNNIKLKEEKVEKISLAEKLNQSPTEKKEVV
jgi:hypothetical protein